jgi:hypothetical protein
MIADPCYLIGEDFSQKDYEAVCEITLSDQSAGPLPYKMGHEGMAVAASSGIGDGYYPVYATYSDEEGWGRRVMKLEIDFSDHPFLQEDEEEEEE